MSIPGNRKSHLTFFVATSLCLAVWSAVTPAQNQPSPEFGRVLRFGESDEVEVIGLHGRDRFDINGDWTVELWGRFDPDRLGNQDIVADMDRSTVNDPHDFRPGGFNIRSHQEMGASHRIEIFVFVEEPDGIHMRQVGGRPFEVANRWMHIAACKEGRWIRLYIDGQLYARQDFTALLVPGYILRLGSWCFSGDIRWFRLSAKALYDGDRFSPPIDPPTTGPKLLVLFNMAQVQGLPVDILAGRKVGGFLPWK